MSLVATSAEPEGELPKHTQSSNAYDLSIEDKEKLVELFSRLQKQLLLTRQIKEGELDKEMEDPKKGMAFLNNNFKNVLGFMCVAEHHGVNLCAEALGAMKHMRAK